ncbi:MAG: hypothetical protein Q8P86_03115 [bacterium]|nr:hypothetical protein [bacterium]
MIKIVKWVAGILVLGFVVLVIGRAIYLGLEDRTEREVEKIHATKLTLADVMGENLPPDPGEEADDTVEGIDANGNGIRDDVELAIFDKYPDSAKTRAALLQYALALQLEMTQDVVNEGTVNAVIEENSRAGDCIADVMVPREGPESSRSYSDLEKINEYMSFVDEKHLNNSYRKTVKEKFYSYLGSYSNSPKPVCDIDVSNFQN